MPGKYCEEYRIIGVSIGKPDVLEELEVPFVKGYADPGEYLGLLDLQPTLLLVEFVERNPASLDALGTAPAQFDKH